MRLPQLLYHGTTKQWHDKQHERHNCYLGAPLHLHTGMVSAAGYAYNRSRIYKASPLLLIVDTSKIPDRIIHTTGSMFETEKLFSGEYIAMELPLEELTIKFIEKAKKEVEKAFGKKINF